MRKLPKALTDWSDLPQWVAWNDTNGRKVPKAVGGGNAKSNDPSTWGTLSEAMSEAERNGYTGVGIELDNGLVGIDLDDCVQDGQIEPWAQKIIDEVGSYAEISPSGTGVHILATADPQSVGCIGRANHHKGIEVYNHGRYFTVTGNTVNDRGIVDATDAVSGVMAREFPEPSPEDTLKEELARLARSQVSRRANETVSHNVKRDSKSGVRFARVPMGIHTCDFCNMLASRGFVFWSKESAGDFSHWHADCRCKVVPGVPEIKSYWKNGVHVTRGIDPTVEGYDPDLYFAQLGGTTGQNVHRALGADVLNARNSSNVVLGRKQFGKKASKHCKDWGLDPKKEEDRERLKGIIADIIDNSEEVFDGEWRGQPSPCTFYIKGEDAVIVNGNDEFVTVMRGAARDVEHGGNRRLNSQRP